ncbi:MAG: Stp1/IreP family PP2C-type Ser/Thr phosphatase [Clostridiales bacterium]|nr:Stp1/IreP family PP2C-type Ser/Thr phosphatase [Clostridiales bacterium]
MIFVGKTDIGLVRDSNQDSFVFKELERGVGFAVLCDGMGGHRGGKVAGQLAAFAAMNYIEEYCSDFGIPENTEFLVKEAVAKANGVVFSQSLKNEEYKGMGSTIVVLFIRDGKVSVCHVGDSRVYLLRDGELTQVTKDHSIVQELVDKGALTESAAENHPLKNVITKAVGTPEKIEGDYVTFDFDKDDIFLICSDGLSSYVEEEKIRDTVNLLGVTEECCDKLISLANESGGNDNVTVVLCGNKD